MQGLRLKLYPVILKCYRVALAEIPIDQEFPRGDGTAANGIPREAACTCHASQHGSHIINGTDRVLRVMLTTSKHTHTYIFFPL